MAALTGTDLVTDALDEIGAHAAGETLNAADGAKGLAVLNRLIDTSQIQAGAIYGEQIDIFTLIGGQQSYTIGVDPTGALTATFPVARPSKLIRAQILINPGSSVIRRPIDVWDDAQWAAIRYQNVVSLPRGIYNDEGVPLSRYYLHPTPDQAYQLQTYTWQQFKALAALTTPILVPPGYYEYWLYSLAIRLCAPFGKQASPTTLAAYQQIRADLFGRNAESPRIGCDGDHSGCGLYNWMDGQNDT